MFERNETAKRIRSRINWLHRRLLPKLSYDEDKRRTGQRVSGTEPYLAWRSQDQTLLRGHLARDYRPRPQELSTMPAERLLQLLRSRPHYGGVLATRCRTPHVGEADTQKTVRLQASFGNAINLFHGPVKIGGLFCRVFVLKLDFVGEMVDVSRRKLNNLQ